MTQAGAALHRRAAGVPTPEVHSERQAWAERLRAALAAQPLQAADAAVSGGRLERLSQRFGLGELERDALALLWVGAFDPELRAQAAALEPFTGQITVRLLCRLFGHPERAALPSQGGCVLWQLVQEQALLDGTSALAIDPSLLPWLEGEHELQRELLGRAQPLGPPALRLPAWAVEALSLRVRETLGAGQRLRLHLPSADEVACRAVAAGLGQALGWPVLELGAWVEPSPSLALLAHRQAHLDGCLLLLPAACAELCDPRRGLPAALQIVWGPGALPPVPGLTDLCHRWPPPGPAERELLWHALYPPSRQWPAARLADLCACHEADGGDIAAAATQAPGSPESAAAALRERSRGELGSLARLLPAGFGWEDLVLPAMPTQHLREIAFEARERAHLWAQPEVARQYPYGRGLIALFSGPPGTGKTMAAQVIAADLGLDLLAVDLAAVVSKWVGETAQHLQQLLQSPSARRAVLFFDEADALFARRVEEVRDAQDRYANLDTSHLMTALEAYPGIVLLATNLKGNVDTAFLRRIRHLVDFPRPDAAARACIWQGAVRALFGVAEAERLWPELRRVANLEASGAAIKNAALSAAFAARRLQRPADAQLLAEMLARELAKEGEGLSARQLQAALAQPAQEGA